MGKQIIFWNVFILKDIFWGQLSENDFIGF